VGCKIEHPLNIVRCLYNFFFKFKFQKYVSYFKIQGEITWISIAGAKDAATSGAGL
jgi:cytochrome c oxidase subunit IV